MSLEQGFLRSRLSRESWWSECRAWEGVASEPTALYRNCELMAQWCSDRGRELWILFPLKHQTEWRWGSRHDDEFSQVLVLGLIRRRQCLGWCVKGTTDTICGVSNATTRTNHHSLDLKEYDKNIQLSRSRHGGRGPEKEFEMWAMRILPEVLLGDARYSQWKTQLMRKEFWWFLSVGLSHILR